jgi:hypothetical protein
MLGYLTLLGTVLTLGTMLIAQMAKFNGHEQRCRTAEAKVHNLIEHFRRDVRGAERLAEAEGPSADRMILYSTGGVIVYQWSAPKLTRTWQPIEGEAVTYEWQWDALTPEFFVEPMGGRSPVIWLKWTSSQWDPNARLSPPGLSTAAHLGGGPI